MNKIKTIIIEDEPSNRNLLKQFLASYTEGVKVVGEAETIGQGVQLINETLPDLVFLDVELRDGNGFDILNKIKDRPFLIVFLTGYKKYAIKAIKYGAFDYLLKPLIISQLVKVIDKVKLKLKKEEHQKKELEALKRINESVEKILIRSGKNSISVVIDDVEYCQSYGNYSKIIMVDGKIILSNASLTQLEELLPELFYRVHKSYIVNTSNIIEYKPERTGVIVLRSTVQLPLSNRRKKDFEILMKNKLLNKNNHQI